MRMMATSGILALLAVTLSAPVNVNAGEAFMGALGTTELQDLRAGDDTSTNSFNETLVAESTQTTTATSEGNSITAETVTSGNITVSDQALSSARGMINFTANSAPNAIVQGTMSVTVILNN